MILIQIALMAVAAVLAVVAFSRAAERAYLDAIADDQALRSELEVGPETGIDRTYYGPPTDRPLTPAGTA